MALKEFLAFVDDKLEKVFSEKKPDPAKAREPAIKAVDLTLKQWGQTEPVRGRKYFKVNNSVVAFTPPFTIGGKTTVHLPSERFPDALKALRASIEAGELDDELVSGAGKSGGSSRGGSGKGWTEERRARYQASVAARKAGGSKK